MTGEQMVLMSLPEARRLTDEVKADAEALWSKLLRLYEGGAHAALGYSSWGAYFEAEFGQSGAHGYRLLNAARVAAELDAAHSPIGESVGRELASLRGDKERLNGALSKARERYGDDLTAAEVREVVQEVAAAEEVEDDRPTGLDADDDAEPAPEPCARRYRVGSCSKPALPGHKFCDRHLAQDALSKFERAAHTFEAKRREALDALMECGWSKRGAAGKLRDLYRAARAEPKQEEIT